MLTKYVGFKTMGKNEMVGIKGGNIPVTGCVAVCLHVGNLTYNGTPVGYYNYAVSGLSSCEPQMNLCQPFDQFISCSCETVTFPGN